MDEVKSRHPQNKLIVRIPTDLPYTAVSSRFILIVCTYYPVVAGSTVKERDRNWLTCGSLPSCRAIALSTVMVLR
ncbi:hypothetical protein SJA_C1-03580 [Sphingobium indicum UT26S]|uniref:Uncharacterized protein n=1 Tax=Sphingobium indicum (strain DSM 16413 / CCM 7287 / MTCC 6362 / UT26 / NBRC 101211 / UT26S) TaxID=452662 RepID=D4YXW0_SPHIU|nr:hypothetical protein SJA_C1-03580 [Sphingobium indicum UT26S]